jgi:hypothetical protein
VGGIGFDYRRESHLPAFDTDIPVGFILDEMLLTFFQTERDKIGFLIDYLKVVLNEGNLFGYFLG